MALPLYLAMTGSEILENGKNFSPFGMMTRLDRIEEIPSWCPAGGMLILTDEIPIQAEDRKLVSTLCQIVQQRQFESILLDFQRLGNPDAQAFVNAVAEAVSCPICVSECYVRETDCAVLLPPVPPDMPVEEYLHPWQGREVWLEAALDGMVITVTPEGAQTKTLLRGAPGAGERVDAQLCCHYRMEIGDNAVFTLRRTAEDLRCLLEKAEKLGIARAVGLYQELGNLIINE